jgi:hypothetical protein
MLNSDGEIIGTGGIQGNNTFQYCMNNPVMLADPNGNWPSLTQMVFAAAIVVGAALVVIAVVATAGAAGAALGMAAGMYLGASSATMAAVSTIATVGAYGIAAAIGACALSDAGEALSGTNIIRDDVMGGDYATYDAVRFALMFGGQGILNIGSMTSTSRQSKLEKFIVNPQKLKNMNVSKIQKIALREGLQTGTLSDGSRAGQGFKVNWGGDRLLQYHPGGGHHGPQSYWKISSGNTGTIRIFND